MRSSRAIFVIRDSNIDGVPDEFMDKTTPYRSNDKYFLVSGDDMEDDILALWNIGISFTVNKYLYKKDSVLPSY
jgi:hypothetical protein